MPLLRARCSGKARGGRYALRVDIQHAILLLLAIGLPIALLFHRLGVSALVAYLLVGALAGPHALGWVQQAHLHELANIGAALLLFTLGLEMDPQALRGQWRPAALAGAVQIGGTIIAGLIAGLLFGFGASLGIALGACLAMSSTLLLLRGLEERRLRTRPEGQISLNVSLLQDISLGPILLALSFLFPVGERPAWWIMLLGLVGILVGTALLRQVLASRLVARVRGTRLPELEVALAVVVALGAAALSDACGLGAALGAFCAGLAFGGNESRQTSLAAVTSLQGLTAILFFAATGTQFDPRWVWNELWLVVAALIASLVIKSAIAGLALRLAGMSVRSAIGCGILLGNIGEFGFVMAAAAFGGIVHGDAPNPEVVRLYKLIIAVTFLSFLSFPLLAWAASRLLPRTSLDDITATGATVVVAGLGPVGNTVVAQLRERGLPVLLVDRNEALLRPWRGAPGIAVFRGPIEDMEQWLPLLGHRPSVVVLAFPIADTSAVVARRLRSFDPGLVVIARAPYLAQVDMLRAAGAHEVICDEEATGAALAPALARALRIAAADPNRLQATRFLDGAPPAPMPPAAPASGPS